jgi:putative ABC transport system permease protein
VAADPPLRSLGDRDHDLAALYLPLAQETPSFVSVALRTAGDPKGFLPGLRREIAALDPDLPIYWTQTMEEAVNGKSFYLRLMGAVFAVLGGAALLLASVGIYGVISFAVGRRTQEIGIRMALGAQRGRVLAMILKQGAVQLAIGLGLGLALALPFTRILRSQLFEVSPTDPATFLLIAVVLGLVALFASLVPAQRAVQIDPLVALKAE